MFFNSYVTRWFVVGIADGGKVIGWCMVLPVCYRWFEL
jgi:hypothetical protein